MALQFVLAGSDYLERSDVLGLTGWPVTIACWFYMDSLPGAAIFAELADNSVDNKFFALQVNSDGTLRVRKDNAVGVVSATTTTTIGTATLAHACGVFASDASMLVYLNGGGKAEQTTSRTWPLGSNQKTRVGARAVATIGNYMDGRMAEVAIWNVALTDADVASLSKGFSPLLLRPNALVAWYPLGNGHRTGTTTIDRWKNRYDLTEVNGLTVAEHPRLYYPSRGKFTKHRITLADALPVGIAVHVPDPSIQPAIATAVGIALSVPAPTLEIIRPAAAVPVALTVPTALGIDQWTVSVEINGEFRAVNVELDTLEIDEQLNDAPDRAHFQVRDMTPAAGQSVQVSVGFRTFFGGSIARRGQAVHDLVADNEWDLECVDWTRLLNRRRVNAQHGQAAADVIATSIITTFTSGFTTTNVTAGLPVVTDGITFTDETVSGALTRLAKRIGAYWYIDATRDLHLFLTEAADSPDPVSGALPDVRLLHVEDDINQWRTRVFCEGNGSEVPVEVLVGETVIPVEDAVWYATGGGLVKAGPQRIAYGGKVAGGAGALVGTNPTPDAGPNLARKIGSGLSTGRYGYAVTFVTASGETKPGPTTVINISTASLAAPSAINSAELDDFYNSIVMGVAGDTFKFAYTFFDGVLESTASPESNTVTLANAPNGNPFLVRMPKSGLPAVPSGQTRRWYRNKNGVGYNRMTNSEGEGWGASSDGTYFRHFPDDRVSAAPPGSPQVAAQVDLSAILIGPTGTTARKVYRTVADGSQLKLLTTLSNNTATTFTDSTADGSLGADAPTSDGSGLTPAFGIVLAGSTTILVTSLAAFQSGGGWAEVGGVLIKYAGTDGVDELTGVPASGRGALTVSVRYGAEIVALPMLTGIPATGEGSIAYTIPEGSPVRVLAQEDDLAAQAIVSAIEGGDGIHEHVLQDNRLSYETARARAQAELALFARTINTVTYETRDPKTRTGKTVTINLGAPTNVSGDFIIQQVTRTEILGVRGVDPLCTVVASSVKFSIEDLLRRALTQAA